MASAASSVTVELTQVVQLLLLLLWTVTVCLLAVIATAPCVKTISASALAIPTQTVCRVNAAETWKMDKRHVLVLDGTPVISEATAALNVRYVPPPTLSTSGRYPFALQHVKTMMPVQQASTVVE